MFEFQEKSMRTMARFLLLTALSVSAFAADVSYKGFRPDFIIDVRTPAEFAAGHIDGAINIPVDQIEGKISTLKELKPGSPVLLYCRSGRRSAIAASILGARGYQQVVDGGGMDSLVHAIKVCQKGSKSC